MIGKPNKLNATKLNSLNQLRLRMLEGHEEKVDETKEVIRSHKSKKDRQYNG